MKPSAGAHPSEVSVPLGVVLRDYLEITDTAREARRAVGDQRVYVDGKPATDVNRSVGFMDVVSFPEADAFYRVVLDARGRVLLVPVDEDRAEWKLARVEDKTTISGGRQQLNLHDGRNHVVEPEADEYNTGDSLQLSVPDQAIQNAYTIEPGRIAMITGGSHAGELATVEEIEVTRNPKGNLAHLTKGEEEISTIADYVFVIGADDPAVTVPEVSFE
jgi:small subunit ribosomal protein S4e